MSETARTKAKAQKSTSKKRNALPRIKSSRLWSPSVHTESTFPPEGLFTKDAATIARNLASKKTSPKGPASGMRMLNFYINRAGRNLSASQENELKRAKTILSEIIARKKKAPSS